MLALIALATAAPLHLGVGANLAAWNQAAVHLPLMGPTASLRVGLDDRPWSFGVAATAGWAREDGATAELRSAPVWLVATARTWRERSGLRVGFDLGPALWSVQTTLHQADETWVARQSQVGFALGPSLDVRLTDDVRSVFSMTGLARKSGFDVLCTWQLTLGTL